MARKQKLIHFHGTQKSALEARKGELNLGEIAVLHGSVADAALAIKISGNTEADNGKLVYFSSSDSVDARFSSAFTAIDKEVTDRGNADTNIQKQIGEGYSSAHTIASAMSLAETAISNLEHSASTYYNNALQNISATAGTFVTVEVGAKTGTPNAGVQGLTIGVTTGQVSADKSALADAKDVKAYVDEKVGDVNGKLGDAFSSGNTVQKVVGTGFTSSSLTEEIVALKNLTGDTESALQAISASTTTVDALGNVQISVSEKKGTAGKYYQEIGVSVTTGSTSEEGKPGLATASDVYSSIATAKTTLTGTQGDASSANTIWGAKKYAEDKIAAVKIGVTGDSYVTATTTGHNITIETNVSTDITGATAGQVADAKAVKDYVDGVKTALTEAYKGADTALDNKITAINDTIGDGFSKDNTITTSVNNIKGRIDALEAISSATKSALQKVEVSPATDDSKYITFNNSVSGTTGKVVADIIIASVDKDASKDGLADAAEVRAKFNTVEGNLSGVSAKVNTLIGSDTGKTVREIANAELAAQLIPEGAKESLNTLQEIAAWIQSHPDDASAMNAKIQTIAGVAFGGFDESGNTKTDGLSGVVASLKSELATETTNRTNADTYIQNQIGNGFDSANTVADSVSALGERIGTLEGLTGKTNSAAQGVSGTTTTTATLDVKTSRDANNNVTITVDTKTGAVEENAATLVTGGAVYTEVSAAEKRATDKANEKVETVALGEVKTTPTSTQSGAKVLVGSGDDKLVTLDLSELVIDCGEF